MLHVEIFDNNHRRNVPWEKGKPNPHKGLYDPSLSLLQLARCGKWASINRQASMTSSTVRTLATLSPLLNEISQEKFGILTMVSANQIILKPFRYAFSAEDALWTAKFIMGEAGGRDDIDNRAVIWAMFNRYALFTNKYYNSFTKFLRAYSTPLQPVLKSPGAAARHYQKKEYIKTGGYYDPPYSYIPKGLLRRHKILQEMRWSELTQESRNLAVRALKGLISNPIGNATEFASTLVYFRQAYKRAPTDDEWRRYTEEFARKKNWKWIGPIANLNQKNNAFFIQKRRLVPGDKNSPLLTDLTSDIVKVI
jgi:hypothetical protein